MLTSIFITATFIIIIGIFYFFKLMQDHFKETLREMRSQFNEKIDHLSQETKTHLYQMGEKTTATFADVLCRLTIIDEAQKKITELSGSVVSLQEILIDKRARGAFGEVQLIALIRNMLPEQHFVLQHELSNKTRVDCMLFLPPPTGNITIDAKFPLESYRLLIQGSLSAAQLQAAKTQFRQDIRKHLREIAHKYILPGETADGAMMFIPAEAIFAEIHGHFPELIDEAHQLRVWLVSPTTLMAILTTARAVIKDAATRKQVHIIQEHLIALGKDFSRFQGRMDNLSKHIQQANEDVSQIHLSSQKITRRFNKIEKVELKETSELTDGN